MGVLNMGLALRNTTYHLMLRAEKKKQASAVCSRQITNPVPLYLAAGSVHCTKKGTEGKEGASCYGGAPWLLYLVYCNLCDSLLS
jgi:hypothetical protein